MVLPDALLSRATAWACSSQALDRQRAELVPLARGRVVELGAGAGMNLPHYTDAVERVWAVEPSPGMWRRAAPRVAGAQRPVEHIAASAEAVPLPDGMADTVVVTWTLCSVTDPARALAEVRRLLAPGGRYVFAEHGRARDAGVQAWQARLDPAWRWLSGCSLTRDVLGGLADAGFVTERVEEGFLPGPRLLGWQTWGVARLG